MSPSNTKLLQRLALAFTTALFLACAAQVSASAQTTAGVVMGASR